MNPLTRVHPDAASIPIMFNSFEAFKQRPTLTVRVAQAIGVSSEIEVWLGVALANLMQADHKAVIAMYSSSQSRSAQERMLRAAVQASNLPNSHQEIVKALLSAAVNPAFRERDKLAHWVWGISEALPNDLLIVEPKQVRDEHIGWAKLEPEIGPRDYIYVITETDLDRLVSRLETTKELVGRLNGCLWNINTVEKRNELFQHLSQQPTIRQKLEGP